MAKSSKQSYETQWQKAFEDAEVQPSAQLWKNIESDLNATENAKFKRGLLFYRTLAAAAVAGLVILGIYTWSDEFSPGKQEIAVSEQQNADSDNNTSKAETEESVENVNEPESMVGPSEAVDATAALAEAVDKGTAKESEASAITGNTLSKQAESTTAENKSVSKGDQEINQQALTQSVAANKTDVTDNASETGENIQSVAADKDDARALHPFEKPLLTGMVNKQGIDDSALLHKDLKEPIDEIYPIPIMPKDRKKDFQPTFFAGLNLSTDYFNPNYQAQAGEAIVTPNAFFADQNQEAVYNLGGGSYTRMSAADGNLGEENTARLSFSYGVNFGMALSEHWIIESGLAYSKYNTSTQTSATFQGISADETYPLSIANNGVKNLQQLSSVRYEETQLTNTFDFVAVPMKIGYNLSFDRINIVFGTGVAANFLLQNSISDDAGRLNEVTIKPDESSPFRKVYYSGILSGGIHYQLMEKYSFSITPSYNFSISSLTKSESNFMSLPYTFGIDFGIRYQF